MHDGFFERVTVSALDRGVTQFVVVGAGHDGRALRHDRPGTRWWHVGDPRLAGLAAGLARKGFEPDSPPCSAWIAWRAS
jgi:O-methyltransferase involved in polyketide biosynthesis